jgi:hypothetical protein
VIRGVTLDGAMTGIEYYILKINVDKLASLEVICYNIKNDKLFTSIWELKLNYFIY